MDDVQKLKASLLKLAMRTSQDVNDAIEQARQGMEFIYGSPARPQDVPIQITTRYSETSSNAADKTDEESLVRIHNTGMKLLAALCAKSDKGEKLLMDDAYSDLGIGKTFYGPVVQSLIRNGYIKKTGVNNGTTWTILKRANGAPYKKPNSPKSIGAMVDEVLSEEDSQRKAYRKRMAGSEIKDAMKILEMAIAITNIGEAPRLSIIARDLNITSSCYVKAVEFLIGNRYVEKFGQGYKTTWRILKRSDGTPYKKEGITYCPPAPAEGYGMKQQLGTIASIKYV